MVKQLSFPVLRKYDFSHYVLLVGVFRTFLFLVDWTSGYQPC